MKTRLIFPQIMPMIVSIIVWRISGVKMLESILVTSAPAGRIGVRELKVAPKQGDFWLDKLA